MSDERTYNSPLRERQAQATRDEILDALIDLVSEAGAHDLNIKDLAKRADVSERTIYRHFPDRTALIDGLFTFIDDRAHWGEPVDITSPDDLKTAIDKNWAIYDKFERETRALVLMNLDPARTATRSREHIGEVRALVQGWFPDLSDDAAVGVSAILSLLVSSRSWLRLLDGHSISGADGSRYVRWVVGLMISDLEAGNPIPPASEFSGQGR